MDASLDVFLPPPPLIVPSQSYRPPDVVPRGCTRCGRPTVPGYGWNVCPSCTARPSAAMAVGVASSAKLFPTALCAACRVPFSVPAHYRPAHALCPLCRIRRGAKPNPAFSRANPYPVVESTYPYPYPPLPQPPPTWPLEREAYAGRGPGPDHAPTVGCRATLPRHVREPTQHDARVDTSRRVPCLPFRFDQGVRRDVVVREVSSSRDGGQRAGGGDDGLEMDLVYPDDVPVARERVLTFAKPKPKEVKPVEDQDEELELVYPEDVAEKACASSSKPPTTLRELFTQGLRTIPTLRDVPVLADENPPRRCRMLGCDETLPAQTSMERCVKCSTEEWKRRKLAASKTSDASQGAGTDISSTINASTEEDQVMTMLDERSNVVDQALASSPSESSSTGIEEHGVGPISGWDSDLTDLSSDSESESSNRDPDSRPERPLDDTKDLTIHIPLLVNRLPPHLLLQKCANKRCNIALSKDHRWKTCDPCRKAHRTYQRMRFEKKRRREMLELPDMACRRCRSLSPDLRETDANLTLETSRPCTTKHCPNRIPLSEVYQWKTCNGCRARARREARRKRDALTEAWRALCPPSVVPRFPAYQNRGTLLSSFGEQLKGFVEGQLVYLRAKLRAGEAGGHVESASQPRHVPMVFVFVGEYSVVTGQRGGGDEEQDDRNDAAEMEAMRREVSSVVSELERTLRTTFSAGEAFAIDNGGMIMRFTCALELIAHLRPLASAIVPSPPSASTNPEKDGDGVSLTMEPLPRPRPPAVPLVKTLSGELEAVVVPDESHRLFRGRRTVIRYSMLG